ncbi:MAG: DNA primase DnaG [Haloferacaceae archaeon]
MDDTSKYLIHAAVTADGVVERSDVVGAIFGQTEGLLGEELDLRDLQQSSKVGRIDVEISSERGQSFGEVTIASSLDRVQTAILAASLETITRVGPCRARVEVTDIEDVREAKRREVVERAKELLAESFDDGVMTSGDILEEVRESVRVEEITEYEGLPAGPRVPDSDALIVVEGRADVLTLLGCGIKHAVAVEGTDVPDAVADLTAERTVTAFLDGDRGGELVLRELAQVGDVDHVAFAPEGRSVEDLDRSEVMTALREKVAYDSLPADGDLRAAAAAATAGRTDGEGDVAPPQTGPPGTDAPAADGAEGAGGATVVSDGEGGTSVADAAGDAAASPPGTEPEDDAEDLDGHPDDRDRDPVGGTNGNAGATGGDGESQGADRDDGTGDADPGGADDRPPSLREHVREVVHGGTGLVRLLDDDLSTLAEGDASAAFDLIEAAERAPRAVVLDGELSQRTLDVLAQRGVDHAVARSTGEFVKRPVEVRVRTADQVTV